MARIRWAEIRKILEQDLLCDLLKGRVQYFTTRYRKAHDDGGRVCVLVDDKEIINMPFATEYLIYAEVHRRIESEPNCEKSISEHYNELEKEFSEKGIFEPWDFGSALDEYLSSSIQDSLNSENRLVQMFAIMDRRVGKRTLEKIRLRITDSPEWLRFFYELRFECEGMSTHQVMN